MPGIAVHHGRNEQEMAAAMLVNLRLHTDAWDLAEDLTRDETSIVVLDVRPKKAYEEAHIPGARSFPHREITRELDADARSLEGLRRVLRRHRLQRIDKGRVQ